MTRARIVPVLCALLLALSVPALAKDCSKTSSGNIPINDLGTGNYNGSMAGLYPNGSNVRPLSHDKALDRVGRMVLLNTAGQVDPANGIFLFMSIGNSNVNHEWQYFMDHADADPVRNDRMVLHNGAQVGKNADEIANPLDIYWTHVDEHLAEVGYTPLQVQAIWFEESLADPTDHWPDSANSMLGYLRSIVQIIKARYPNVSRIYHSSRIYGGYAPTGPSHEPYCYEYGFSTKWLIEQQLNGDPTMNFDPAKGPVLAPWMAWGPYMWADGLIPRSDGLTWLCSDFRPDGKHPNDDGNAKITAYLLNFFKTDPTSKTWFADCDLSDPNTFGAPLEVRDLVISKLPTGEAQLSWASLDGVVGSSAVYDLVSGTLDTLRQDQGFTTAACRTTNVADTPYVDTFPDPPEGQGYYYLIRGRNTCASGTFGDSSLTPDPRDVLDASACTSTTCGNGDADPGEQCDGLDLNGKNCSLLGYKGGLLACTPGCQFDTTGCTTGGCGDGHVDPSEDCDGSNLNGHTCVSEGHDGGTLACAPNCKFDESGCTDCGDGVREGAEACDGSDLGGQTCTSQGHVGGVLGCTGSCFFDASGCTDCGDGAIQPGEQCDGANLNGQTCQSQGFGGGNLACSGTCSFVTTGCTSCGNGVKDGTDQCDGSDLGGATCESLGFTGGTLACSPSCGYDTSGCTSGG